MSQPITIPAITVRQPWASLIALGLKKFETRSWATKHRGYLAIHAGQARPKPLEVHPYIAVGLREAGCEPGPEFGNLPYGAVLCIVNLQNCYSTGDVGHYVLSDKQSVSYMPPRFPESFFGDFSKGRYAWDVSDHAVTFIDPVPARGRQGVWQWQYVPDGERVLLPTSALAHEGA